jgi:hypothetical protein
MAKNDVAVKNEGAVALVSTFEQDAMGGFDGMDQEDYALPFLRLLTNTSPEVGSVEGAMPGMVYNTVTGELMTARRVLKLCLARTFASTSSGHHAVQEVAHQSTSTLRRVMSCPKRIGNPAITRTILTTGITSRIRRTTMSW